MIPSKKRILGGDFGGEMRNCTEATIVMTYIDNLVNDMLDESMVIMLLTKPHIRAKNGYYLVSKLLKISGTEGLYLALNIPQSTVKREIKKEMHAHPKFSS